MTGKAGCSCKPSSELLVNDEHMTTGTHRDLIAWQEAMNLAEMVYYETESFPREERYGLTAQLRRASFSVPSLIAEGAARNSSRELYQYLGWAVGSVAEVETQLELSIRLKFLPKGAKAFDQARRVGRLVNALRNSYKERIEGR